MQCFNKRLTRQARFELELQVARNGEAIGKQKPSNRSRSTTFTLVNQRFQAGESAANLPGVSSRQRRKGFGNELLVIRIELLRKVQQHLLLRLFPVLIIPGGSVKIIR